MNVKINLKSLAPTSTVDNNEVYEAALESALNNDDIRNIGITGPYGSGKSSVLKTYEHKHKEKNFLNISLASFNEEVKNQILKGALEEDGDIAFLDSHESVNKKELEQLIELSIIQQIFYHVKARKIPDSRFKRIISLDNHKIVILSILSVIWLLSIIYVIRPKFNYGSALYSMVEFVNHSWFKWLSLAYLLLGAGFIFWKAIRLFNNVKLSKLNFKDGEIELGHANEQSILNRYLDEIIYFFEVNQNYKVVVFEDLDRFKNYCIFSKLREINNLLNNYEPFINSNHIIKFIYALCDDHFKENKNRTKFFDVLIPIIPVINTTNSGDKLEPILREIAPNNIIENEFLQDIQLYIDDMRLLYNITNEYQIYNEQIGNKLENKTKLFAMIVYKNVYPTDFVELHNGKGIVFKILKEDKDKIIEGRIKDLRSEISGLNDKIQSLKKLSEKNAEELCTKYVVALWSILHNPTYVNIRGVNGDLSFNELLITDNFSALRKNGIYHYFQNRVGAISKAISFSEIEKKIDNDRNYQELLTIIQKGPQTTINELLIQIEDLETEIKIQRRMQICDVVASRNLQIMFPKYSNKKFGLLMYLIKNGYIDEDYQLYLSYFYPGSLTIEDQDFLLSIKNDCALDFEFKLSKIPNFVHRIHLSEFQKPEVLNIDLLDFLLAKEKIYSLQIGQIINQITKENTRGLAFLDSYIEIGSEIGTFIRLLANKWVGLWIYIENESGFSEEKIHNYLVLLLRYLTLNELRDQDRENSLTNYLADCKDLFAFIPSELTSKTAKVIYEMDGFLKVFSEPINNKELFEKICMEISYEFNPNNIGFIFKFYERNEELIESLKTRNYTTIHESSCNILKENIETLINEYIEKVFLKIKENRNESEESIIRLLNNKELLKDHKEQIIQKWDGRIGDINDVEDKELWGLLFKFHKVVALWENVLLFANEYSIDNSDLVAFFNNRANYMVLTKIRIDTVDENEEEFVKKISLDLVLCDGIIFNAFVSLIPCIPYTYDILDFQNLSEAKIKYMIGVRFLNMTVQNFEKLKEHFPNQHIQLVESWINPFLSDISNYRLDSSDLLLLLESKKIKLNQQIAIIKSQSEKLVVGNIKLANTILDCLESYPEYSLPYSYMKTIFENSTEIDIQISYLLGLVSAKVLDMMQFKQLISCLKKPYSELILKGHKPIKIDLNEYNLKFINLLKLNKLISSSKIKNDAIVVWRKLK